MTRERKLVFQKKQGPEALGQLHMKPWPSKKANENPYM